MWIGYGISLTLAFLFTRYQFYREAVMFGAAVASGMALYSLALTLSESRNPIFIATAILGLLITLALVALLFTNRKKPPVQALLILMLFIPVHTVMGHWWDNEQRGHLLVSGMDTICSLRLLERGKPLYPEMTKRHPGGTDPGRFCPTYMIFCESQIPPHKRRDPNFDRRDVYIITQTR